jgi:uncharacterized membrane protein
MSSTDSGTDSTERANPWRNVLLVLSLCLNVALIAILAVGVVRMAAANRVPFITQPAGPLAPGQVLRSLSAERRQALQAVLRQHRPALTELRQSARQARQETFKVFSAPQFDNAAFNAALERVSAADGALEDEAVAQVKDLVAALTPQERQKVIADRPQPRRSFLRRLMQRNP